MRTQFDEKKARPFLKWAGGKGQLLPAINAALPKDIHQKKESTYMNPYKMNEFAKKFKI